MKDLEAIAAVYEQIDNFLENQRDAAGETGEREEPIALKQRINDQAYFVLAWGQLEAEIEEACRQAIRRGQEHEDWKCRRAWSLYNPEDRRLSGLSLEDRLTLVLEKGTEYWKRAMQLYNVRNQIAHGALRSERIDVSSVVQDFYRIQSSLTRS